MTTIRGVLFGLLFSGLMFWVPLGMAVYAQQQDAPKAPALTDVQKLQVLNASKDVDGWQTKAELYQTKYQQASAEFEKARDAFAKLLATVVPKGYRLTASLELEKAPDAPTPDPKPEGGK